MSKGRLFLTADGLQCVAPPTFPKTPTETWTCEDCGTIWFAFTPEAGGRGWTTARPV